MDRSADSPEPEDPNTATRAEALLVLRAPSGSGRRTLRISMSSLPEAWRGLIPASRTWLAGNRPSKKQLSLASFMMLGASDAAAMSGRFSRMSTGILGAGAGIGLILTSAYDMGRAERPTDKLDAASNLAWGYQGILALSSSTLMRQAARGLGVAGALVQTSIGVSRIRQGYKDRDGTTVKVGALDVGSGLLWLGWDLLAWQQPLLVGGYVLLGVTKEGIANRTAVEGFAQKARGRAASAWRKCAELVEAVVEETAQDVEQMFEQVKDGYLASSQDALALARPTFGSGSVRVDDRQVPASRPSAPLEASQPAPSSRPHPGGRMRVRVRASSATALPQSR